MSMGGLLIQRRANVDRGSGRDAITIDVDIDCSVSVRIPCNGAVKRVPGGVVCIGGLASEGVWAILCRR